MIDGGSGAVYTPVAADATGGSDGAGLFIHAVATYTDGLGAGTESASGAPEERVQVSDPANTAPKFPDQDLVTAGDQSDSTMRSVPENDDSATVGEPVNAGDGDTDRLLYALSGDDASMFKVDREVRLRFLRRRSWTLKLTMSTRWWSRRPTRRARPTESRL